MQLYNSLSQRIEDFAVVNNTVRIYTCGVTPYDTTHLGHAFTYAVTDVLVRYLEYLGHNIEYVQNVTDIDDDILRKAGETGENWMELGNRWTTHFIKDMQHMNIRPPDHYPRATDVIPEIVTMVQQLIDGGVAYENNGNVYYSVEAWPEFGNLSHLDHDAMLPIANERGNKPDDTNKKDPLDFVLWQAKVGDEPAWESPWGMGRPGWHIECSTMSTMLLGETLDIHVGGGDLQFPHHECEIAQVEPLTGKPFVRVWMHVAMVEHEGEKMSKSLGNLIMMNELLEQVPIDVARIYLAWHHYREAWEYDEVEFKKATQLTEKLHQALTVKSAKSDVFDPTLHIRGFNDAMQNDLDTPAALKALGQFADEILVAAEDGQNVSQAQQELCRCGRVFGMDFGKDNAYPEVVEGWEKHLQRFEPVA
ncbi:MAG: cysteine--tRNA ligase [Chloroflexi bacterium]|nr:MAG: cysteine--tRNA ligase [Chloroflexota bacterium]MBL1196511.1 cysteine--tRNA ligase [Chloroflexota bacterium]NOH13807.1 cysteine--tRNA ligase [Chloroflexota bacterium]